MSSNILYRVSGGWVFSILTMALTSLCPHMEQVAADIGMELVFSEKGVPRGRGKVERFFRSVDQLFLQDVPGYAPKGYPDAEATLTLPDFERRFRSGCWKTIIVGTIAKQDTNPRNAGKREVLSLECPNLWSN